MHSISAKARRWLDTQLPLWVAGGAITADQATAIDALYGDSGREDPRRLAFLLLAIAGSALVGAGIILLIAHNWDELSRPVRCAIAFLPLLAAQALSLFVLRRRDESAPWREGAAIFNVTAVGAAISLVSQTYQIQGDFARFILVWMLLALPLVFLLRSTLAACAYLVGSIVWVMSVSRSGAGISPLWFWVFVGAVLPHVVNVFLRSRSFRTATGLAIILGVATAFGLGRTNTIAQVHLWGPSFAGLFALVYLAGCAWFRPDDEHALHPLVLLGFSSTVVLTIVLSFQEFWRFRAWDASQPLAAERTIAIGVAALFVALPFIVLTFVKRRTFSLNAMALALPLVTALAWAVAQNFSSAGEPGSSRGEAGDGFWLALLISFYALSFGIFTLVRGVRGQRFVEANVGLVVIASLAIARFFDSDLGFVTRGVAFVVVGLGFIAANLMLFRRRSPA